MIEVTREELYKMVWKTPIQRLSKIYQISDTGLSKTCKRLKIPVPGRGYWAAKAAGKPAMREALPEMNDDCANELVQLLLREPESPACGASQTTRLGRLFTEEQKDQHWANFLVITDNWTHSNQVREFIKSLEQEMIHTDMEQVVQGKSMREWMAWAKDHNNKYDPLTYKLTSLFEEVVRPSDC